MDNNLEKCEPVAVVGGEMQLVWINSYGVKVGDNLYTSPQPIEKCEPVAEALHERNRLGYAVVDVIGTLDEIIENAQEVEVDDFLHIAIPIDKWHELQDALEEMPKRAELYTSPQPIEKCEPVAILHRKLVEVYNPKLTLHEKADITFLNTDEANKESEMRYIQLPDGDYKLYTSPISKEWVGLSDEILGEITREWAIDIERTPRNLSNAIEAKLKQLNTKG